MKESEDKARQRLSVVGAAILRDGRCLATRRGPRLDQAGLWEFPGGKVEAGETPAQALRRELREELGIEVEVGAFLATGRAGVGHVDVELDVYLATTPAVDVELREHDQVRWLSARELWEVEWAEADVPAVEALERLLEG
jgi:8-oxo-dGTP diphosphatase